MGTVTVDLEEADVELTNADIGVSEGTLTFDVSGVIRGLDAEVLNQFTDGSLVPTEIRFRSQEEAAE